MAPSTRCRFSCPLMSGSKEAMTILKEIERSFDCTIRANLPQITTCATLHIACEKWFQLEFMHYLLRGEVNGKRIQVSYEDKLIDLVAGLHRPDEVLIELKTVPTNYGLSGAAITNSINSIIKDLDDLHTERRPNQKGLMMWLAYPIPCSEPNQWKKHLARVIRSAHSCISFRRYWIGDNQFVYSYIMKSK